MILFPVTKVVVLVRSIKTDNGIIKVNFGTSELLPLLIGRASWANYSIFV